MVGAALKDYRRDAEWNRDVRRASTRVSAPVACHRQNLKLGRLTILNNVDTPDFSAQSSTSFAIMCRELDERTSAIDVEGELDLTTAPRLKWMLLDSIQAGRNLIVLDLTKTTFMDSTALGVLVVVNRNLEADAGMAVACPNANVLRIFELSGMDGAFAIFPSFDEALSHVKSPTTGADRSE
jgi:anti-sigma B factor antagonist